MRATKRRSAKSGAADAHERAKDYLDPPENQVARRTIAAGHRNGGRNVTCQVVTGDPDQELAVPLQCPAG